MSAGTSGGYPRDVGGACGRAPFNPARPVQFGVELPSFPACRYCLSPRALSLFRSRFCMRQSVPVTQAPVALCNVVLRSIHNSFE